MSEESVVLGIVFAHGAMAEGVVGALRGISGASDDSVVPISNEGKGPQELRELVDEVAGDRPTIVFVDLQTGSCGVAARLSCHDRGRRAVVCGVNLPMLLDFVFHRHLPLDRLVARLVSKGRDAIQDYRAGPESPASTSR